MTTTAARPGSPPGQTVRRTTALPDAGRARLVPLVSGVVMLLVGLWGLDRGSMWQDEAATYEVARRSVGQILAMLDNVDVVHGLYYLVMHVWLLPGGGEVPFTDEGEPDEDALAEAGAFELEGFAPNETRNATYDLEPGTYTLFCIVEDPEGDPHSTNGMVGELTVE